MDNLRDKVVYDTDFRAIGSPGYYDCCIHCLCTRGYARFRYFGNEFELTSGRMAVISYPERVTDIETRDGFTCEYIAAPSAFLHGLLPVNNYALPGSVSLTRNPVLEMTGDDMTRMHEDFQGIRRRISNTSHIFYREMVGSLLRTMVYDIFDIHARRDGTALQTSRVGYVVRAFIDMIQSGEATRHRSPAWYADKLSITPKYMGDTVKRITGTSVSTHINRAAAAALRQYIADSHLSMTEIAEIMNFSSLSYLNRFCRLHLGASPSELRRIDLTRRTE